MIFLALKTEDGRITGKISFYCRMLGISRQGFYKYLANKDRPWKYQDLADAMKEIINEDECNDTYGRIRMYQTLLLKQPEGVHIPCWKVLLSTATVGHSIPAKSIVKLSRNIISTKA